MTLVELLSDDWDVPLGVTSNCSVSVKYVDDRPVSR